MASDVVRVLKGRSGREVPRVVERNSRQVIGKMEEMEGVKEKRKVLRTKIQLILQNWS
jgi:hypothetical protein